MLTFGINKSEYVTSPHPKLLYSVLLHILCIVFPIAWVVLVVQTIIYIKFIRDMAIFFGIEVAGILALLTLIGLFVSKHILQFNGNISNFLYYIHFSMQKLLT